MIMQVYFEKKNGFRYFKEYTILGAELKKNVKHFSSWPNIFLKQFLIFIISSLDIYKYIISIKIYLWNQYILILNARLKIVIISKRFS